MSVKKILVLLPFVAVFLLGGALLSEIAPLTSKAENQPVPLVSPTPISGIYSVRLRGSEVAPPVTTSGRGGANVFVNQSASQNVLSVFDVQFANLSSSQTAARLRVGLPGTNGAILRELGAVGGTSGRIFDFNNQITLTEELARLLREGKLYVEVCSQNFPNGELRGQIRPVDFDNEGDVEGDGRADIAVFRPSTGVWYSLNSSDGAFSSQILGGVNDVNVSGDYDGDGATDFTVFHQTSVGNAEPGSWEFIRSSDGVRGYFKFGQFGDFPVRGDFDGDGKNDFAVFRQGSWFIQKSVDNAFVAVQFGQTGDLPVAGDFDGDRRHDIAVFRPESGFWFVLRSGGGGVLARQWGAFGDLPAIGDYDGDEIADFAVYRESNGAWYIQESYTNALKAIQFGANDDIPAAADYDGDGKTDLAVFRPSNGTWYIEQSTSGFRALSFGQNGDRPLVAFRPFDVKN